MIQSAYNKPIEPKAPKAELPQPSKAPSSSKSDYSKKSTAVEKKRESDDFESELKAAESQASEPKVKEVKVSEEQRLEKPSKLVNPNGTESDPLQPTIFDPEMTMDVEQAIKPKTVQTLTDEQVLKLANGEVPQVSAEGLEAQALSDGDLQAELAKALKNPKMGEAKVEGELAKSGADSQLMSMEDFIAQKNMMKKPAGAHAYGAKPQVNKLALETGLKQTQIVKDLNAAQGLEGQSSSPMNSQQFILNMQSDNGTAKMNEAAGPQKVFDMSNIKSSNSEQIMSQISDYIIQAKASKEPTVTMRLNHDELGMIDITVQKSSQMNADAVAINIGTHSVDGKNFFQQNSKDLFAHLTSTGINVADLKVDTPSSTAKNDFDMNGGSRQGQGSGAEKQFGSEQNQRRHEQERRQDLWKLLNKEAA